MTLPTLSFANDSVGILSAAQSVTLANTGSASITVSSIAFTGSFTIATGGSCGAIPDHAGRRCELHAEHRLPADRPGRGQRLGSLWRRRRRPAEHSARRYRPADRNGGYVHFQYRLAVCRPGHNLHRDRSAYWPGDADGKCHILRRHNADRHRRADSRLCLALDNPDRWRARHYSRLHRRCQLYRLHLPGAHQVRRRLRLHPRIELGRRRRSQSDGRARPARNLQLHCAADRRFLSLPDQPLCHRSSAESHGVTFNPSVIVFNSGAANFDDRPDPGNLQRARAPPPPRQIRRRRCDRARPAFCCPSPDACAAAHATSSRSRRCAALILSAAVIGGLSGCGAGSGFFDQKQQTYTINVVGTVSNSGATLQHLAGVSLTVQ